MSDQGNQIAAESKFPVISRTIAVLILIGTILWYLLERSWEPLLGIIGSFATIFVFVASAIVAKAGKHRLHQTMDYLGSVITVIVFVILVIPLLSRLLPLPQDITPTSTITPSPTSTKIAPTPTVTAISKGPELLRLEFTEVGDGNCNNYDYRILGYESHQYYIHPPAPNGYMSECGSGEWGPRVSLEVEAYPKGDLAFWGYGLMIGWQGKNGKTTDTCVLGVQRNSGIEPVSQVVVKQRIDDVEETLYRNDLDFTLDAHPHKLRIVMLTDSLAVGYLDNQFIGEFEFRECLKGRVGLIAWGTGDTKIYFDNLILNSLP